MWALVKKYFRQRFVFAQWRAISPSGQMELGVMTERQAVTAAAKFGAVSYVDPDYHIVFYNTQSGGAAPTGPNL